MKSAVPVAGGSAKASFFGRILHNPHGARPGLLVGLLVAASSSWAQVPSPPGQVLQDVERSLPSRPITAPDGVKIEIPEAPALSPSGSHERVTVRGYRIQGNTAFDAQALQGVLDGRTGELSFAQLNEAARALTDFYRSHGYPLARAYLPQQEIQAGVVTIAVLEGRYDRITAHNRSRLSDERVARTLNTALCGSAEGCGGALIARAPLERGLLLLDDVPGAQAAARLSPGSGVGTSSLDVDVADEPRVTGLAQLDNTGSYYSGSLRALGSVWINNPTGIGDQITAQAVASRRHGRLGYGGLGYSLPLGYGGWRLGVRGSYLEYELGDRYDSLDAHGIVKSADATLSYPLIRSRAANLSASLAYGERRFRDSLDAVATRTYRAIRHRAELGLGADLRDELFTLPALNTLTMFYTSGELELDAASAAVDASTARTRGDYSKWGATYSRLQSLAERTSVYLRVTAQYASDNLDSYEKFPLGGPDSVRAYASGEMSSDKAALLSVELRQRFPVSWTRALEGTLFYDWATGARNASPWQVGVDNRVTLRGAGIGINVALTEQLTLRSALAWRGERAMTAAPDRHQNFSLSLSAGF